MGSILVLLVSSLLTYWSFNSIAARQETVSFIPPIPTIQAFNSLEEMLKATGLSQPVQEKVLRALKCTDKHHVAHNNILTVIDYSLPSNQKRLWVYELHNKKLLFHTYVSHGIKSGTLFTNYFSNKFNSKASSVGVFKTEKAYYGREGLSLRLDGLESMFNDNASNRSIVMHGGWYVDEPFIKRYGRPGRSWGCPAVPRTLFQPIINTIKDNSLFVMYYPMENWLVKSRFLNCESMPSKLDPTSVQREVKPALGEQELRDTVLMAYTNKTEVIMTMTANNYEAIFQQKPPLSRMLRRRIDNVEYIALSTHEFNNLAKNNGLCPQISLQRALDSIYFITPVLKMIRGYYETQMKIVPFGKIKGLRASDDRHFTVYFESKPALGLRTANEFIRWLGL